MPPPEALIDQITRPAEATLKIPFESGECADIVFRVLSVDKEPRRNFVQKELRVEGNYIEVHFTADEVKKLRTAITSFFEALLLCKDTIKEFGSNTELTNNAGTHTSSNST
ncbi:uncharacterized protein Tcs6 [Eurosta solidaginis]|uniref:uncharacterized protein Tcs6 n=1 Tax=Eurosta solidaginis TaxID=178769 RepID=UPI0035309DAC